MWQFITTYTKQDDGDADVSTMLKKEGAKDTRGTFKPLFKLLRLLLSSFHFPPRLNKVFYASMVSLKNILHALNFIEMLKCNHS